ncbi:MAG: patatin-like phospholipase family protein [Cyanobacteria bacterium SZAS LIN-5]|nr:patatin-like phospholipase family protein [Cyanobacteria bacterium SZAS LIN-5]RTL41521.1 MAG: patatin-like phospholipase family protein [Candidatus Melainabacteria bacterium]
MSGINETLKEIERPKRALVLSGGGARGAYEVGVLKALREQGIEYDLAFGTSIGGINAAFYVQGKIDRMEELWTSLKATDIFRFPNIEQIRSIIRGSRWGLFDTNPLEELLYREMNLDQFKNSPTRVGFLTTDLCTLETRMVTSDDINSHKELIDILMASSALPILFPARTLFGEGFWIDGGLVRNTPIQTAINMGAKEIHIVLVEAENDGVCPSNMVQVLARCADILLYASARDGIRLVHEYNKLVHSGQFDNAEAEIEPLVIKVFQPSGKVNTGILGIDPLRSVRLIEQGYFEAMSLLALV